MRPIPALEELTGHRVKQFCKEEIAVEEKSWHGGVCQELPEQRGGSSLPCCLWPVASLHLDRWASAHGGGKCLLLCCPRGARPRGDRFPDFGETLVKRGHCFGPMLCHQLEMVVASHKAHQRQKGKAVHWVALGRWRVERDPTWVLLLLSTWGTKDEDVPSGPALAEGLLCVLELVAKPFCVALIFVPQTEKWRC